MYCINFENAILHSLNFNRPRGPNRTWTDEEMYEMMDKINRGYTYQDVTDGTHVPISTLWTRLITYSIHFYWAKIHVN